jgi:hypothetical protein
MPRAGTSYISCKMSLHRALRLAGCTTRIIIRADCTGRPAEPECRAWRGGASSVPCAGKVPRYTSCGTGTGQGPTEQQHRRRVVRQRSSNTGGGPGASTELCLSARAARKAHLVLNPAGIRVTGVMNPGLGSGRLIGESGGAKIPLQFFFIAKKSRGALYIYKVLERM